MAREAGLYREFIRFLLDSGYEKHRNGKGDHVIYRSQRTGNQVTVTRGKINMMVARRLKKEVIRVECGA